MEFGGRIEAVVAERVMHESCIDVTEENGGYGNAYRY